MGSFVQAIDREAIFAALFALVSPAYAWKSTPSRRLKLWGDVPLEQRPALFQFEGTEEGYTYTQSPNPKRVLEARLFVYTNCKDTNVVGATQMNQIITAIETALLPQISDTKGGNGQRNSLGGLVHSCRIEGRVFRDPGDLDGDGLLRIPVIIECP